MPKLVILCVWIDLTRLVALFAEVHNSKILENQLVSYPEFDLSPGSLDSIEIFLVT